MMVQPPCDYPPAVPNPMMEKVAVSVSFALMIALNVASSTGVLGLDLRTLSANFPTYVTPDGLTFAIWGLIYFLFFVLVVVQCMTDPQVEEILSRRCTITGLNVRWRLVATFLLNALWLPAYIAQLFAIAFVIIASYLTCLFSLYYSMNPGRVYSFVQVFTLSSPIGANTAWLLVATSANFFTVAGVHGWSDQFGVSGTPIAAIVVVLTSMSIALYFSMVYFDFMWPAVAAWALAGIYRMQTIPDEERFPVDALNACLAKAACITMIVCVVFAVGAFLASVASLCLPRGGSGGFKSLLPA